MHDIIIVPISWWQKHATQYALGNPIMYDKMIITNSTYRIKSIHEDRIVFMKIV